MVSINKEQSACSVMRILVCILAVVSCNLLHNSEDTYNVSTWRVADSSKTSGLLETLFDKSGSLSLTGLQHITPWVIGNPRLQEDSAGLPRAVHFPSNESSGLILILPDSTYADTGKSECPWELLACISGQFTARFSIFLDAHTGDDSGATHVLSVITRSSGKDGLRNLEGIATRWALTFTVSPRAGLKAYWGPLGSSLGQNSSGYQVVKELSLQKASWHIVQATVFLNGAEDDVKLTLMSTHATPNEKQTLENKESVDRLPRLTSPENLLNPLILQRDLVGLFFGNAIGKAFPAHKGLSFGIGEFRSDTPDTGRRRFPRLVILPDLLGGIPTNPIKSVTAMNFPANSFVKYEFKNRLKKTVDAEELIIDFVLPSGVIDGLIWFAENHSSRSYVYIKNSRLYYTYVVIDQTGRAKLTLTEEIFLNNTLVPDVPHELKLLRNRDKLTLTLDESSHASKSIDGRVPLVPSDGSVYLGGSIQPHLDTGGKVDSTFRGRITKAKVSRTGDGDFDFLQAATDPRWKSSVSQEGSVKYEYRYPKAELVIGPTSSNRGLGTKRSLALSKEPTPITFMGFPSAVVRFDIWDFSIYRSFEITFQTFEPNGILFFVGPERDHTDFVCVELFDGNVYFVYGIGDHYRHIQLNPKNFKVNLGTTHRVYVSRNEQHRFLVKFNDIVVDVDQGSQAHQTEFSTYTYIGSVDQPSRLPWYVWSRENFAGCILSIRVNGDKFLDPSSRMSQHTDVKRGLKFGECKVPDNRCSRTICGGGQCIQRSYPFLEPLNFACDCSRSEKTFPEGVEDIRRSKTCLRDAPILQMDGEMVLLIDFERQNNAMTTHTDDISLQFKTQQLTTPLFYAVAPAERSYFRVDLIGGRISVKTNINFPDDSFRYEEIFSNNPVLAPNQWYTLYIKRRADHIEVSIDGYTQIGTIPLQSQLKTFKLVAQQIYLGSAGPADFSRPPPPTSETTFLPSPPRFIGEFRNFYWNEYDFIGTEILPNKYITDLLSPRAILPTFPQWPRDPTYSITCTKELEFARLNTVIDIRSGGDMWLIEFKTDYDGVVIGGKDLELSDRLQISLVVLRGRLHVVYSTMGRSGVYQIACGISPEGVHDGKWHRVVVGLDRRKQRLTVFFDSCSPETVGSGLALTAVRRMGFHFGGLPDADWQSVLALLRLYAVTSVHGSEAEQGLQPAFTGCLGGFSLRTDNFGSDLLLRHDSELNEYPPNTIIRGDCREQKRCSADYCQNGGRCEQVSPREIRCICTGTGYEGPRCSVVIRKCPPNYCQNGGVCTVVNGQPKCTCPVGGYYGDRCELNPCTSGDYCRNGGRCFMSDGVARCDCRHTGFSGPLCETPVCPPNYCLNGGTCRTDANGNPVCDCSGTHFTGPRCEQDPCIPGYCSNGGQCRIDRYGQPECVCTGTGYTGPQCQIPICTPDYCSNGGRCVVDAANQPRCDCRGTSFTGDRCQQPICPVGYCANNGRCMIGANNQPICDCTGTGYTGDRCSLALCTDEMCLNGGRCFIGPGGQPTCSCTGTGFTGSRCQTPICSSDYCLNGGRCQVDHLDQPQCDCEGTGYHGSRCQLPVCTPGYCLHGGECRIGSDGQPVCDCLRTEYEGRNCEVPICPPSYCGGRGRCVVRNRRPFCECFGEYKGIRCQTEVCPENYCINGGICTATPGGRPFCTCPLNYEGERCELPKSCPLNYCFHGGRCTMVNGVPECDCRGTDYMGSRCEIPQVCPVGFCQHNGRCSVQSGTYVCNCTGTGYRGVICNEPIACPKDYCLFGGICTALPNNQYSCDCSRTGRTGKHCESSSNGIYVDYGRDGYIVYPLIPSVRTTEDNVTLGFKTYMQSGTLITFLAPDGRHWALKLRDGRVAIDANGHHIYSFSTRSNDGAYHVLNVERRGDTMMVTQDTEVIRVSIPALVNPLDKSLIYRAIHIAADHREKDIFRGVIGGVHWNGRYPINELKDKKYTAKGEVVIVLTPEFPIHPPKPQPVCPPGYCLNGGRCYAEDYELKCDCRTTGRPGVRCEKQAKGYAPKYSRNPLYITYRVVPPKRTNHDEMRVAFQTWQLNGPIARVIQTDNTFFDIQLIDGKILVTFNGNQFIPISSSEQEFNDGLMHVITVDRRDGKFNFTVDGHVTYHEMPSFVNVDGTLLVQEIVLGADQKFLKRFDGILGAFYWNGEYLIDENLSIKSTAQVMKLPGRQPAGQDEVVVVLMPHLLHPDKPGPDVTPGPIPGNVPPGGGGVIMPGLGTGDVKLGAPIYVPEGMEIHGGGGAGMNAGSGLVLRQAGGILGLGTLVDALLAGLLLALLLLISALIWACWRCKPGCCGFCFGKGGMAARDNSAWNRLASWCCAAPGGSGKSKETKRLLDDTDTGKDRMDGKAGTFIEPLSPPVTLEPPLMSGMNIYNVEGMKVDCVLITKNSKYFVTGSGMGPPKVWDAQSGEVHKIMDGSELGCTDLHLACDDTILVTQVIDDLGTGMDTFTDMNAIKVKRLQLWDFATGAQRGMGIDVMCTATCLARESSHVIASRVTQGLPSILVWNLARNQVEHEIPYHPLTPALKDSVTYLNISFDDRLVVAGFTNPTDQQACYMVFDLSAHHDGPFEPRIVPFDAKVDATEIIGDDIAVTGTNKGELLVWNLHTGAVVRQIQISATLEGGVPTLLPPHTGTVHCIRLSADRRFLVTGSQDQLVRVWVMPDERLLHTLEGHADDVLSVAISTDSELIVSGSWDGSIRVWRLKDGKQICWFTSNIEILQVKISEDKQSLVALGERTGFRKLITLRVVRNRVRTTTTSRNIGAHTNTAPSTPGFAPSSPEMMA